MHPPSATCRALYRLHPQLRLGWAGRPRQGSELNPGSWALVQLYHVSDCGDIDEPVTFREYWNVTTKQNFDGTEDRIKIDRGPIFNRFGGTSLDYDPVFRFPIYVIELSDELIYPWGEPINPTKDVFSGKIIEAIRHWLTPAEKRIHDSHVNKGNHVSSRCDDMGGHVADRIWRESQRTGYTHNHSLAYKHAKKDIAAQDEKNQKDVIKEYYKPPKMPSRELKTSRHG